MTGFPRASTGISRGTAVTSVLADGAGAGLIGAGFSSEQAQLIARLRRRPEQRGFEPPHGTPLVELQAMAGALEADAQHLGIRPHAAHTRAPLGDVGLAAVGVAQPRH